MLVLVFLSSFVILLSPFNKALHQCFQFLKQATLILTICPVYVGLEVWFGICKIPASVFHPLDVFEMQGHLVSKNLVQENKEKECNKIIHLCNEW